MQLLLTSNGISNTTIHNALEDMLGKPIAESRALFIPTAIYPFPGGAYAAGRAISGAAASPLAGLGWKSLGVLELTALSSIDDEAWIPTVQETDALLVWGGDPLYLAHWMRQSGLAALLPSLRRDAVYVGVSAGSIAMAATFGETYVDPPRGGGEVLSSEDIVFDTPQGEVNRVLVTAQGVGLVDFAVIPHLDHPDHPDASHPNAEKWAAHIPLTTYAIDDNSAVVVDNGTTRVVSEGRWKLFQP